MTGVNPAVADFFLRVYAETVLNTRLQSYSRPLYRGRIGDAPYITKFAYLVKGKVLSSKIRGVLSRVKGWKIRNPSFIPMFVALE